MVAVVKVGDIIKSLDFAGNDTCYKVGKVVHMAADGYMNVDGFMSVWEGKVEFVTEKFGVPAKGDHFMDERFPGRVTVLA